MAVTETDLPVPANKTHKKESISVIGAVVHDMQRMAQIANVLRKFGFGNFVKAVRSGISGDFASSKEIVESFKQQPNDMAVRLRSMIEELGTTYIKFGQMLSTRYDLLPQNIINELTKLQDASPKMSFETIEGILNEAYGDYHQYFESIEDTPLGSASIAQAHRAVLKDGSHVVIKIQRPNLLPLIRSDIDILNLLVKTLDDHIEEIAYFNLPSLIDEFERSIVSELDFMHERANIEYFMHRYHDNPMFVFPEPDVSLTRSNILVMKEIVGQKITQVEPNTEEARHMADAILDIAFEMVMRDGVFHADPHPGNIFATPDHKIGLIDFGLVGNFTPRQRKEFMHLVLAIQVGDCSLVARTLISLGHPTRRVVLDDLAAEISGILHKYYKNSLKKIDMAAFASEFVSTGQKYAIQIPSEFTNAVRAVINIEGIIAYLNPELDVVSTLGQFSKKLISDTMKQENFNTLLFQMGLDVTEFGRSIPTHFAQIMQDLEHDGLAVRVNSDAVSQLKDAGNSMTTRLCISLMLMGITLCLWLSGHEIIFDIALIICVLWVIVLGFWYIRARETRTRLRINPLMAQLKRYRHWK